jgi:hypothetical protein
MSARERHESAGIAVCVSSRLRPKALQLCSQAESPES